MPKFFKKLNRKGIVLITAYMVIVVAIILTVAVIQRALSEYNIARGNRIITQGVFVAEGAIEYAAYTLGYNLANYMVVPDNFSNSLGLFSDFNVTYTWTALDADHAIVDPLGITTFVRNYHISATAVDTTHNISVTVNQIVSRKKTYTFQHAVFYNYDLEMLPGPNMTLSGRIHSNQDIYLGTHNTFTIDTTYLYSAGDIYNKRKDSTDPMAGTVRIKKTGTSDYYAMLEGGEPEPLDCDRADWTDESQNRWAGTAKSSVHGVTSLAAPSVASIEPTGFYASNADLKIVNQSAYNNAGSPVSLPVGTVTQSNMYNYREGKWVTVTNIDMNLLNTSGYFPSNGLLYVTRTDASPATPNGVRLQNGSQLNGALTVVSDDPVYVRGDYNNTAKKPAAIISDSLDILSNNWNDANSNKTLSNRIASNTTVNAAFIAGVDTTIPGGYNGGLENYPRFLENWTGKILGIRGSFVGLWNSQIAQGAWVYGSPQYTAPNRDWNYDTDFNNSANLPPFTPFAVETARLAWWKN
jgi:hypothetical protein